jgi:hypothetical protein
LIVLRRVSVSPFGKRSCVSAEDIARDNLERVKGIEPSYSAWKAAALPLSYTREIKCLALYRILIWHGFGTVSSKTGFLV